MKLLKVIAVNNSWFTTLGIDNHGFEIENLVFNDCHDLIILCLNLSDIAVFSIKGLLLIILLLFTAVNLKQFMC